MNKNLIPILISVILFGLSLWAIAQELHKYTPGEIWASLSAIPANYLLLAVGLTCLNYLVLTGYDTLAVRYVRHPIGYFKTATAAVINYGISNSVGLALLSGSAIRYRLYSSWGLSIAKITQIIAFANLSFWLGLFAMGGIVFLVRPFPIPEILHLPFTSVDSLGIIFLCVILAYLSASVFSSKAIRIGAFTIPHLPFSLAIAQITVASLDWMLAAAVFYVLLPSDPSISWSRFFGVYLLAQIAGVVSNVPGGLGVFETVMLLLLSSFISSANILGALLVYRGIYYLLPLIAAALLLGTYELRRGLARSKN
ncbi:MAG: lysylphosphatidylglycerol synthase domain-containing protein [Xenococcaceae cyanobacterium]